MTTFDIMAMKPRSATPGPYRFWGSVKPPDKRQPIRAQIDSKQDGTTAVIRLYDPVDSWGGPYGVSAKEFASALDELPQDTNRIELHINSPGGEAFEAVTMLNMLRAHQARVVAVVDGLAASAASLLAAGADETVMGVGTQLMVHKAWALAIGNADDLRDYAALLDKLDTGMAQIYRAKAGGDLGDWLAAMSAESWYTADEAVAAGLADRADAEQADDAKAQAEFDLSMFAHAGRDDAPEPFKPAARQETTPPASAGDEPDPAADMPTAATTSVLALDIAIRTKRGAA